MDELLQKAIELIKSGQRKQGGQILAEIVKQQPNNESAWLWLVNCVNSDQQKVFCLKKALEINPKNDKAHEYLVKLQNNQSLPLKFIDNEQIVSNVVMDFMQANCPYCNGELRVPKNRQNIKCMYCGKDILVQGNNLVVLPPKNIVNDLLSLATAAQEAKNYEEAYKYYSQVLEEDSSISIAWIGKGISAGWLSSVQKQRIEESVTCIAKGLESDQIDSKLIEGAALNLIYITQSYTKETCQYLNDLYNSKTSPRSGGVLMDPIMTGIIIGINRPAVQKKVANEFLQIYRPVIIRASTYAWDLFPSIEIAAALYKIINIVNGSILNDEVKTKFKEDFEETLLAIKHKFPKWQPPKDKKDCFIATATMGDHDHPYVIVLREYRDKSLLHHSLGKVIVRVYYHISPPFAKVIKNNSLLKLMSLYLIIKPSVFLVNSVLLNRRAG